MLLPYDVVIPTDFSDSAAAVVPLARRFAATFERPLRLLHVESPLDAELTWMPASARAALDDRLSRLEAELSAGGVAVTTSVRRGFAAREILDAAAANTALVALGLSGHAGEPHRLFGSVAAKVLRASPVPVLTARRPPGGGVEDRPIRRVLMPVDFSELETGAFAEAAAVVRRFGATLDLVHVVRPPELPLVRGELEVLSGVSGVTPQALAEIAQRELSRVAEHARALEVSVGSALLREGEPVEVLVDHIHATDPDLVIMSAHGRRGFSRLLLGSVTEAVTVRSTRPLLVLKPQRTYLEVTQPPALA